MTLDKAQCQLIFSLGFAILITCGMVALSIYTQSLLPLFWLLFGVMVALIATFIIAYLPALAQKSLTWILYFLIVGALMTAWLVKNDYPDDKPPGVRNPLTGQVTMP